MKHLKQFNEDNTEKLEAQDLLDFSQDIVDAGYGIKYHTFGSLITPDDIMNARGHRLEYFDIDYKGYFRIEVSDFPMSDFQRVLNYMEAFKKHVDEYYFVLDDFKVNTNVSDMDRKPIITTLLFYFVKVEK